MNEKDKKILKNNEKWFGFYVHFPKVSTWVIAILVFIWSIIDPAVFAYGSSYGVMGLDTFFGAMAIWWGIGVEYCAINYVACKLMFSYRIVQIYYLKQMAKVENVTMPSDKENSSLQKQDTSDKIEKFKKLKALFDMGLITKEEYEAKKKQLIEL